MTKTKMTRRELLKSLATLPVVGALFYKTLQKEAYQKNIEHNLSRIIDLDFKNFDKHLVPEKNCEKIRLGLIGYGSRGRMIINSAGFLHPGYINDIREAGLENKKDKRYEFLMQSEQLNIEINGICDIYDPYTEYGMMACGNQQKSTRTSDVKPVKRYKNYKDLIAAKDIDAVVIATPDHWHAPMIIEAVKQGKHVYTEKCMTRTLEEAYAVRQAVKTSKIVFQLGHQNRQFDSYNLAHELVNEKQILGNISLVQTNTNRNTPYGAWVYDIPEEAGRHNIDWQQFIGATNPSEFSLEKFFRWRLWWDYGTGLSGDMLTHEYDCINQVLDVGIPDSVMASGGIYHYKDGREVPDVFNALMEYEKQDLTLMYSSSLASGKYRPRTLMGTDGAMELSNGFTVSIDNHSQKYSHEIESGIIDTSTPAYSYAPGAKGIDAITSASTKYFAERGLTYTYRNGKQIDTTFLHMKEWLDAIRTGSQTSCNIDRGFEEAVTAHMATISYRKGKKVFWDRDKLMVRL
ncbi:MAG: Gfo/Idh/MocA family protein [Fidelibacterota bacterium]